MMKEEWRAVVGYENYEVSNTGLIRRNGKILKPQLNNKYGHVKVKLCKDGVCIKYFIHRIVATAFIPNPNELPIINHKDENPSNNSANNLEWCTQKYNANYGTGQVKRTISRNIGVIQMDLEGNELNRFISAAEASRHLGKSEDDNIRKCCRGIYKTAHGYKWKKIRDDKDNSSY